MYFMDIRAYVQRTVSTRPDQYCTGTVYVRTTLIFSRKEKQTKREEQEEEMKNIKNLKRELMPGYRLKIKIPQS